MKIFKLALISLLILPVIACGGGGSDSSYINDELNITGVYNKNVLYRVSDSSGSCGLEFGDLSGDPFIVDRNSEDSITISFGIPGQFWTELTTNYWEEVDGGGTEYIYSARGNILEGGDWKGASYTIEGEFEPGSTWAYLSIKGDNCTAEVDIFAYK